MVGVQQWAEIGVHGAGSMDALSVRAKVPYFQDKTLAQDEQYQSRATFVPLPLPPGKAVVQP